ncbi:MAG: ATP-binding protein [Xenococcaceae cyanobacterium MO_167.B52]|nr:ATP-binding protein [Xenococcaceae cyanobacterium MO_167.B52]
MEVELKSLKLDTLLQELYDLFKPQTISSNIDFKIDCEVDEIVADPIKVKQVLTNLLYNCFKFTHTGEVYLRVNRDNITKSQIIFSVIDTGIGIESNDFDHLFDPFIQEDNSIRRSYGGTGLGLSICKKLVELMNGKIWLFSQGKNKGTTVSFSLPIRE